MTSIRRAENPCTPPSERFYTTKTHAGHGTLSAAICAGLPTASFPMTAEQAVLAHRLKAQDLTAAPDGFDGDAARFQAVLTEALGDERLAAAAAGFAERHAGAAEKGADVAVLCDRLCRGLPDISGGPAAATP